jgi:hypothetical protein
MNAPLRLRFTVVPSMRPVGVWITTGHLILTLVWLRFSLCIIDYKGLSVGGFFLVLLQKVSRSFQITGMRDEDATRKSPR